MFFFTPILGEMMQFGEQIFSNGLVQPPTRKCRLNPPTFQKSNPQRVTFQWFQMGFSFSEFLPMMSLALDFHRLSQGAGLERIVMPLVHR